MGLEGRRVVVTGGGRGIGRGIALSLARSGADIAIVFRRDQDAAEEIAEEIRALGRRAAVEQADVTDHDQVVSAVGRIAGALGQLDALVCSAGVISRGRTVAETDLSEFRRLLDIHLFGALHFVHALLPGMRQAGRGDIVFISSHITRKWRPGSGSYSVAKAGLEALMRVLAREEQPNGIRVNAIAPSVVNTEMGRRMLRARGFEDPASFMATSPFGRIVEPDDIGALCSYLLSEQGGYISGQVIYMDAATVD